MNFRNLIPVVLLVLVLGCTIQETNLSDQNIEHINNTENINQGQQAQPTQNVTVSNITGKYLMAFHACNTQSTNCFDPRNHITYVAESNEGVNWSIIPGYMPHQGSVPDLIRRGSTLYVFNPGSVRRYSFETGLWEKDTATISVKHPNGSNEMIVDPSPIIDEEGRIVLFYMVGQSGSDPAQCLPGTSSCTKLFRSATEVIGSEGTQFIVDPGNRVEVELTVPSMASDPDIFESPRGFLLYVSRGSSVNGYTSSSLRGDYSIINELPNSVVSFDAGGIPSGYYDSIKGKYWVYVHKMEGNVEVIKRSVHADFSLSLSPEQFQVILRGADLPELGASYSVASPGFTVNEE